MLRRFKICPNAYYNYLKNRKSAYYEQKEIIKETIVSIYHKNHGILGYRQMKIFLEREGIRISCTTCHRYMNTELKLYSICRRKRNNHASDKNHKTFDNLLNQDFTAGEPNKKWCTDFTYLFLANGSKRYNCSIIDLHDRSVVASVTDKKITADLAKRTLQKAIDSQPGIDLSRLIVHSDQGSQYTSKEYTEFCESLGITQSMSKAGYPYDNAPIERYFNTLKNDLIYQHSYHTEKELYAAVEEFAYVHYNHVRPHSYNNYKTPYEARCGVT